MTLRMLKSCMGFTLVEVALALAVFSFAILAIFGLFLSGMNNERNSATEQAAESLLASLTSGIEGAVLIGGEEIRALAPLQDFTWSAIDGGSRNISMDGFSVRVEVGEAERVGGERIARLRLALAWPPESATWDENGELRGEAGSLITEGFFLLP